MLCCTSLGWLRIVSVLLQFIEITLCYYKHCAATKVSLHCCRCITVTHLGNAVSPQVSHSGSLGWFCILPWVSLLLTWVALVIQDITLLLTGVVSMVSFLFTRVSLHCPLCSTAAHWRGSALSHVSHCHSLGWLIFVPRVELIAAQLTGSMFFSVFSAASH